MKSTVSRVNRVSRVRIRVSVRIRVGFSFIGASLHIAMAPLNFTRRLFFYSIQLRLIYNHKPTNSIAVGRKFRHIEASLLYEVYLDDGDSHFIHVDGPWSSRCAIPLSNG